MDRPPRQPLSIEEAKYRLRSSTQVTPLSYSMREHPWAWLALAFAAGAFLGGGSATRHLMSRALLRLL